MKESTLNKHKRVIDEWLHNGENGTQAYKIIYPASSDENAAVAFNKILTNPKIQEYEREQRKALAEKAKEEHGITFETQIQDQLQKKKDFKLLRDLAIKDKLTEQEKEKYKRLRDIYNLNGINKVDEMINKMLGFFKEDNEQSNQKEIIIEGFEWGKES